MDNIKEANFNWKEYFNNITIKELTNILSIGKEIQTQNIIKNSYQQFEINDKYYTGKTYYKGNYYYKVISGFAENRDRVVCIFFPKYPFYTKESVYNDFNNKLFSYYWCLHSLEADSLLISELNEMEEISLKEWEEAFDKHVEKLKYLKVENDESEKN